MTDAPDYMVVAEPGWDSPRRVPLNGIALNWRVNAANDASAEVETAWLRNAGLLDRTDDCEGWWLSYDHPRLGLWAGVIRQVLHDLGTATTEVAAAGMETLLEHRRTDREYLVPSGDCGGIASLILANAGHESGTYLTGIRIGPTEPVDIHVRAEMVAEAMSYLADLGRAEWGVTPQRVFEFMPRRGWNREAEVVLLEGRDVGPRTQTIGDARPRANEILAVSGVDAYRRVTAVTVRDDADVEERGLLQGTLVAPYLVKENTLLPAARAELARRQRLGRPATVEVLDTAGAWALVREGDTVRLTLPSVNKRTTFRVLVRSWDSTSDQLLVTGDCGVAA